jgi:hypothetical protein
MKTHGVFYVGRFIVMGFVLLALFTYVVMLLWNWLVPEVFSGPVLGYWQTLGILLLSKILFTGLTPFHREGPPWKEKSWGHEHGRSYWKKKFEDKLNGRTAGSEKQGTPDETGEDAPRDQQ